MSIYHESLIEQIDGIPPRLLYNERAAAVALSKKQSSAFPDCWLC